VTRGKVWKFGNHVDTDAMTPGKYMSAPQAELMKHVLEVINPRFPREVKPGDMIVAGTNFGCGSSRESGPAALKTLGIGAVIAESFARIFFRNAIAIGLPAITCPEVSALFADGDELELDLVSGKITNLTRGKTVYAQPLPEQMLEVLSQGGILPLLKQMASKQKT
jgi:3-isopropylmalate/(R)-2-methylmalate dehydratase small subunit